MRVANYFTATQPKFVFPKDYYGIIVNYTLSYILISEELKKFLIDNIIAFETIYSK